MPFYVKSQNLLTVLRTYCKCLFHRFKLILFLIVNSINRNNTLVINPMLTFDKYIVGCSRFFIRGFKFKSDSCRPSEPSLLCRVKKSLYLQIKLIRPRRHHTCVLCSQWQSSLLVSMLLLLLESKFFPLPVQYELNESRPQEQADLESTCKRSISSDAFSQLLRALCI